MKYRIAQIIEAEKITRAAFAKKIGVSAPFITQLCNGDANPSTRTIADICREFNIRREWLETGEGPMRLPEPEEDLDYINRLLADDDDETVRFIKKFLRAYNDLSPADQKIIDNLIRTLTNQK